MKSNLQPIPDNEMERLIRLSELDLDFSNHDENFKDLTLLAAKVTGTEISLVNIIDSFTQWSLSSHGLDIKQMPRTDSVCQYTIMGNHNFEVPDFRVDERFSTKYFVDGPLGLRYYYGLPLQLEEGVNIGALCVLDSNLKTLSPEKIELLEIIGKTVIKRLKSYHAFDVLSAKLKESDESKKKAAHDIRGPLNGIIGLSELMARQGTASDKEELMEIIGMINRSGKSLLELADEILSEGSQKPLNDSEFNLPLFKDKLDKLYLPQAKHKNVDLIVVVDSLYAEIPFAKNKLIQITGNLISNAIKFTAEGGKIEVNLSLVMTETEKLLKITVKDNGVGIDPEAVQKIIIGNSGTTAGTMGEKGYGFGLSLVSHLVESLNGKITVNSTPGKGTTFEVVLPQSI